MKQSEAPVGPALLPIETVREAVRAELEMIRGGLMGAAVQSATAARTAAAAGVLHSIASLLAVRLLLMLALAGGFIVALLALQYGSLQSAGILVAYALLIVLPLVWLERNPRVDKPNS
jgi:hypothetical protein